MFSLLSSSVSVMCWIGSGRLPVSCLVTGLEEVDVPSHGGTSSALFEEAKLRIT